MKLYTANSRGDSKNTLYPNETEIRTLQDMARAVSRDNMASQMANNYRNTDNFLQCDCVMFDIDNTHSENPEAWKTEKDITETFPVDLYLVRSRNYMKAKKKTNKATGKTTFSEPREKWHVYCPLKKPITARADYEALMLNILALFPFIDVAAIDCARFFYGVDAPHVTFEQGDGGACIDEYIASWPPADLKNEQEIAIDGFIGAMQDGFYKSDRAAQTTVNKACEFIGMKSPFTVTRAEAQPAQAAENVPEWILYGEQAKALQWLEKWAERNGVDLTGKRYTYNQPGREHTIAICVSCPWENEHSSDGAENEAVIMIDQAGKYSFLCRHSHGAALNWKTYRAEVERRAQERAGAPQSDLTGKDDKTPTETPGTPQEGAEAAQAGALPGLLVYDELVKEFQEADDDIIEIRPFPEFSKTAKIKKHSTVAIAADTGGGKSSLAINFLNALNTDYPCIYFNLEMDKITVLRRLVAIESGLEIDRIEGYKNDPNTARAVNIFLKAITSRQPLQIIQDIYTLEQIEAIIEASAEGRNRPTMVFIDHSLLVEIDARTAGRYERFTIISEKLRKIALKYNIVLFVLLQQNRAGKADDEERPKNSSLKESGSWENDATHIVFLWYDPKAQRKKLLLTKHRGGDQGEFAMNYYKKTQTYTEAKDQAARPATSGSPLQRITKRDKARGRLQDAYNQAVIATNGAPTLRAMAEAADVTTATVKGWIKEYGGCTVDGQEIDPAGIDTNVEYTGFIKLTPGDDAPGQFTDTEAEGAENVEKKVRGRNR